MNTQKNVVAIFDFLEEVLGIETFQEIMPVILTDNGSEFTNPRQLEFSKTGERRCHVFYCDPGRAYQKGGIEKNHEFIRYVIPKGKALNAYAQESINILMDNINCYYRSVKRPFIPFDEMNRTCPSLIQKLSFFRVEPEEVLLTENLIKKNKI
ncbi:MAG: hypothetical protein ACRCUS_08770 [Anaerovoracaceae bacterium]